MEIKKSLVNVSDCILIIMDVQDHFLAKLPPRRAKKLVNRVGWLIEIGKILNVPVIATAEDMKHYGGLTSALVERLPLGTKVCDKTVFGLADQIDILETVRKIGRKTVVLIGVETDVCVAHSAIGLVQNGFKVVVLADVTDSPGDAHAWGLDRMREAGVLVTSLKGLYYEWIRTVSMCNMMEKHLKRIGVPSGIIL